MTSARASLESIDVTLLVERADSTNDIMTGHQWWRLAWAPSAVRWEEWPVSKDAPKAAPVGEPVVSVFSGTDGTAIMYDPAGYAKAGSLASLHPERSVHDYFVMMGRLPTSSIAGVPLPKNDAVALLDDPGTIVLAESQAIGGRECVVAEWRPEGVAADAPPVLRAAFVPELGFAQALFEVRSASGSVVARWQSEEFVTVGAGLTAIPIRGTYQSFDGNGNVRSSRTIAVATAADGTPLVTIGTAVDVNVALPTGTTVLNSETGETWVVASSERLRPDEWLQGAGHHAGAPPSLAGIADSRLPIVVGIVGAIALFLAYRAFARNRGAMPAWTPSSAPEMGAGDTDGG
ncbi:MAG: hypothetical protein U0575_13185 [Phycisphaerales bacterium]